MNDFKIRTTLEAHDRRLKAAEDRVKSCESGCGGAVAAIFIIPVLVFFIFSTLARLDRIEAAIGITPQPTKAPK